MNVTVQSKAKLRLIDPRTRKVTFETPWHKNLVMDNGLNALARSTNSCQPCQFNQACRVGDDNTSNSVSSGGITFTQSGTTITASAGFFTAGMVGWIFKWGTGTSGAEYYITAYTSATQVTVDTAATVAVPDVATVWNVTQTQLGNLLYSSQSYETSSGSCGTTIVNNVVSYKRTYNFAQQVSSYSVNEVGYFSSTTGTTVFGRIVLPSTVVVPNTNFLQVVLTVEFTFGPAAPTPVVDVGTNIDTAGNAMVEYLNANTILNQVQADGTNTTNFGLFNSGGYTKLITANYTQNGITGTPLNTTQLPTNASGVNPVFSGSRGRCTWTTSASISTSGQTLYGLCLNSNATTGSVSTPFDIKLTTPDTLPTGSFIANAVWSITFNRILNN